MGPRIVGARSPPGDLGTGARTPWPCEKKAATRCRRGSRDRRGRIGESSRWSDSTGRELTYGRTLTASLLVSDWVRGHTGADEKIGVLLPPSVGGAVANLGVAVAGRVAVNLNFTAGKDAMASALEQCGIRVILTSKAFLAKAKLEALPGSVYIEDVLAVGTLPKLWALVRARVAPVRAAGGSAKSRFRRDDFIFERQHQHAQGRDALALQHHRQYRIGFADLRPGPHRSRSGRSAVLSFLRLYRDDMAPAAGRLRRPCITSTPWTRRRSAK